MACAGLLVISIIASASVNLTTGGRTDLAVVPSPVAQHLPTRPIDLSIAEALHAPAISPSGVSDPAWVPNADRWDGRTTSTSIDLGPIHTEFGGVMGRHMHLATVRLEGVSLLGASIGGSLDSRSARITFSWRTGN